MALITVVRKLLEIVLLIWRIHWLVTGSACLVTESELHLGELLSSYTEGCDHHLGEPLSSLYRGCDHHLGEPLSSYTEGVIMIWVNCSVVIQSLCVTIIWVNC